MAPALHRSRYDSAVLGRHRRWRSIGKRAPGDRPTGDPAVDDPGCRGKSRVVRSRAPRGRRPLPEGAGPGWAAGHRPARRVPRRSREAELALSGPGTEGGPPGGGTRGAATAVAAFGSPDRSRALLHQPAAIAGE